MTGPMRAVGVDLGGTKTEVSLVDATGKIQHTVKLATVPSAGCQAIIGKIAEAVSELLGGSGPTPVGLGLGVAGQIDASGEQVTFAPNLDWRDVPLRSSLQEQTGLPTVLLNDVRAATWAEWLFGAGRGCDDLVCLFVGTGIGGGVVSGGRVLAGSSNSAGELGHIPVALQGPPCHCGGHGCLEALAGGWAIARRAREAAAREPAAAAALRTMAQEREEAITAELVARAAHAGDPLAGRIVAETAEALIAGAAGLVNAFNPERLILGGGVIEGLPELVRQIDQGVRGRALRVACAKLEVLPAALHNNAGVIGAAALAMRRFAAPCRAVGRPTAEE